jgi:hypothetical protein
LIDLLTLIVQSVAFLLTVMLTTAISGKIVKVEKHHQARVVGSHEYKKFGIAFPLYLLEAIGIAILFGYSQTAIESVLLANLLLLPTFFIEAGIGYYFWFCIEYEYNPFKYWKLIIGFQLPVLIDFVFVYLANQLIFKWPFG